MIIEPIEIGKPLLLFKLENSPQLFHVRMQLLFPSHVVKEVTVPQYWVVLAELVHGLIMLKVHVVVHMPENIVPFDFEVPLASLFKQIA